MRGGTQTHFAALPSRTIHTLRGRGGSGGGFVLCSALQAAQISERVIAVLREGSEARAGA
jgi:hypothetical protein